MMPAKLAKAGWSTILTAAILTASCVTPSSVTTSWGEISCAETLPFLLPEIVIGECTVTTTAASVSLTPEPNASLQVMAPKDLVGALVEHDKDRLANGKKAMFTAGVIAATAGSSGKNSEAAALMAFAILTAEMIWGQKTTTLGERLSALAQSDFSQPIVGESTKRYVFLRNSKASGPWELRMAGDDGATVVVPVTPLPERSRLRRAR